ncbi:MAG: lantibiotic dehydratase [Chlamydiae bacterium]|nr:lantibiotic dehydratase [Chlamydiota bacterium]
MKNREDFLFQPAPFFMVRTPHLPIENFFSLLAEKDLYESLMSWCKKEEVLREALAIASPSLYASITNQKEKTEKEKKQIASSLLKYLLRMTTRSTPFGLFSFVSLGKWGNETSCDLDLNEMRKRARPDMEWLLAVIDKCCSDEQIRDQLKIRGNPLILEAGDRAYLNFVRKKHIEKKSEDGKEETVEKEEVQPQSLSIRTSFLTKAIFEIAKHPVTIDELKVKIVNQFPTVENEKLQAVIEKLLKDQFLCYEYLPSLLTESPFADFISKLPFSCSYLPQLKEIASQIEKYNETPVGQGEKLFQEIQDRMKEVVASPNLLQVDTGYFGKEISLPSSLAEELSDSAEILWRLSCTSPYPALLSSYHAKFLEKYGSSRTVPLLELLDEERGLGIPESYLNSSVTPLPKNKKAERFDKWLRAEWGYCQQQGKKEILVTEEILDKILEKPDKEKAILSFDYFCEIFANSSADIDSGNFFLQFSSNSWQAGATFGRFLDLLGEKAKQNLKEVFREEEAHEENSFFIESSYLPASPRSSNVSILPNLREYAIDLEIPVKTGSGFSLDEIYVGANYDRLYLTLQDGSKELVVCQGSMLNPSYAPTPIRFIRDVGRSRYQPLYSFPWNDLEDAEYLPRVRYKKTILFPARWKVDLASLQLTQQSKEEVIEKEFNTWAQQLHLPRYLFMTEGDNSILLDREHPSHVKEIISKLKKGIEVKLVEKIGQEGGEWIQSSQGAHASEFVVPFVKNKKYSSAHSKLTPLIHTPISHHCRWKLPGSEWLYAKCYLAKDGESRFICENLSGFADFFMNQGTIHEWFFVRYSDPKSHVRIRFRGEKDKIIQQLLPAFHDWMSALMQKGQIRDFVLTGYEREVERYGGELLIDYAETYFSHDALATIPLLNTMLKKKTNLPEEVVAALNCIDILKGCKLNIEEQLSFFTSLNLPKDELKGFREWKDPLLKLTEAILEERGDLFSETLFLLEAFEKRQKGLFSFVTKMEELKEQKRLSIPAESIYGSILHMHCNRFLGTESKKEQKAMIYAYHALFTLRQKMKQLQDAKLLEIASV